MIPGIAVTRDELGVVNIKADSLQKAVFAQGYAHAQQRLFQMDTLRRLPLGEMAELVGPKALEFDKFFRTLGIRHALLENINKLSDYQRELL